VTKLKLEGLYEDLEPEFTAPAPVVPKPKPVVVVVPKPEPVVVVVPKPEPVVVVVPKPEPVVVVVPKPEPVVVVVPKPVVVIPKPKPVVVVPKPKKVIRKPKRVIRKRPRAIKLPSLRVHNPYRLAGDLDLTNKEMDDLKKSISKYTIKKDKMAALSSWTTAKRDRLRNTYRTEKDLKLVKNYF